MDSREIVAAGALVFRKGPEVLLVHRPKYDDWSFPKGKVDPGEHAVTAAVREVCEETGLAVRLGPPLRDQEYTVGNGTLRPKRVHYWIGMLVNGDDIDTYRPNDEIDRLAWLPLGKALDLLTYERDRETLEQSAPLRKRSTPLLVLRHGELQDARLAPLLAAYGGKQVTSRSSRRCAAAQDLEGVVHELLVGQEPAVLCVDPSMLPTMFTALGTRDQTLAPGAMLVAHHHAGRIVATEVHTP